MVVGLPAMTLDAYPPCGTAEPRRVGGVPAGSPPGLPEPRAVGGEHGAFEKSSLDAPHQPGCAARGCGVAAGIGLVPAVWRSDASALLEWRGLLLVRLCSSTLRRTNLRRGGRQTSGCARRKPGAGRH